MTLPSIEQTCSSTRSLEDCLSLLFEPSPSLKQKLAPSLSSEITSKGKAPASYTELVILSEREISTWSDDEKADFIGGHPRIGEVSNLSKLSSQEQASKATPPEVLARLESLNALYESVYPKLRYITFVAGRSRSQVAEDMERFLLKPTEEKDDEGSSAPPATHHVGSKEWKEELERALGDIFQIAKARLKGMGVE